jgi:hypothetical protein
MSDDYLVDMLRRQLDAAAIVQVDPTTLDGDERIQYIKDMILACTNELHEALGEISWKPWATGRYVNHREAMGELRDAWQFLMNAMFAVTRTSPENLARELHDMHAEKIEVNLERARSGYDGVTGKCPQCHRDLAEIELKEIIVQTPFSRVDIHCVCGRHLYSRAV